MAKSCSECSTRQKGNRDDDHLKIPNDRQLGLFSLVCATQSADRNLVRLPRRHPSLSLKADTKMKTTNLKQTSRQSHGNGFNGDAVGTIRARRARSAASSATRGRGYIFVNSRRIREFLRRLRPAQIELHNFSSIVNRVLRTLLAFDVLILRQRKAIQYYETDTWNIAGGRSGVSIDALDSGLARSTVRSN